MTLPVFYGPTDALGQVPFVTVEGPEGHHAVVVRRLKVGEPIRLTDGKGTLVEGVVTVAERSTFTIEVHRREAQPRPEPHVVVVQALPKGERAELAVSLLTEVGVDEIIPWNAERCVVRWDDQRAERGQRRWQRTADEASKQSRRVWWPVVAAQASTAHVCDRLAKADTAIVLHEGAVADLAAVEAAESGEVVVVIGPEGGIGDAELAQFASTGATIVRAGPSVMRTSTAGAIASAVLLSSTPRWS